MEKENKEENKDWKDINTVILEEKIANWRRQMVEDVNTNYVGKTYTDSIVAASMIQSLVSDVQVLMQWCEILASKIRKIEEDREIK